MKEERKKKGEQDAHIGVIIGKIKGKMIEGKESKRSERSAKPKYNE